MIMDTWHAAKADMAEQIQAIIDNDRIPADEALEMIHKITQKALRKDQEA